LSSGSRRGGLKHKRRFILLGRLEGKGGRKIAERSVPDCSPQVGRIRKKKRLIPRAASRREDSKRKKVPEKDDEIRSLFVDQHKSRNQKIRTESTSK